MDEYDHYFMKGLCGRDAVAVFEDLYAHCSYMQSQGLSIKEARLFFQSCKSFHNKDIILLTNYNRNLIDPVYKGPLQLQFRQVRENIKLFSKRMKSFGKKVNSFVSNVNRIEYEIDKSEQRQTIIDSIYLP